MALTQISTAGVKDDAVTSGKIPANAVGSSEIAANAVGASELADEAVTLAKLEHGTSSNDGKFLRANNGADPTFETITGTTINNNADNRVITGSGTANTLEGESTLTYGGTELLISNSSPSVKLNDTDNSGVVDINNVGGAAVIQSTGVTTFETNGSERMRIDSSGKVGIGTTTIGEKFTIGDGDLKFYNSDEANNHRTTFIEFQNSSNRITSESNFGSDGSSGYAAGYKFSTKNYTGSAFETLTPFVIQANGNVGIGTTSPSKKLDVTGDFHVSAQILNERGTASAPPFSFTDDTDTGMFNILNSDLGFSVGGTERMRIDSSGNVGIGVTPTARFHVHKQGHYLVTDSGKATNGIHVRGNAGNAGEYGGAISFSCGDNDSSAAIAARQGGSDTDFTGLSFFTHPSGVAADDAVEKVRIHHSGEASFNNGICLGNGVTLSSANTLEDYEEGTFTPKLRTIGSSQGEQLGAGRYTKIGNMVYLDVQFDNKNATGLQDNNYIYITNLPYTTNSRSQSASPQTYNVNGYSDEQVYFMTDPGNAALIGFRTRWNTTWTYWESGHFRGSQIYVRVNIWYKTNS